MSPAFPDHPVATAEQHAHELAALELVEHPTVRAAYRDVAETWLARAKPSDAMRERFNAAYEEVMFSAAVWSSNQDPLRPKVTTITRLAHEVEGVRIPGTRWGIDNPDSVYRVIPISGEEKYVIRGRVGEHRMTENYFTLWNAHMGTIDVVDGRRMEVAPDGTYEITVDASEKNGRTNHIQSTPEAHEFYIRDVLLDWSLDQPNEITIERVSTGSTTGDRPALTLDEQAEKTAAMMAHFADFTGKLSYGMSKSPANHFSLAWNSNQHGAMVGQVYVAGRFDLEPGQAFVVDVSDGGAEYFTVPLGNLWGTTLDIYGSTSSLNKAQSKPNGDGTYTYVIGPENPGVHNWIDSAGLREGFLTLRMAEFGPGGATEDLAATGRVIDLDDLDKELPDIARIDEAGRADQLAERQTGYTKNRLPEGVVA
ncbi:hypothetical protein ABIE44_001622 [Marmoricola sp. OAE513]|uniref:hypothetical protein n=1 Tax=Marmoricola sp. OAE513 TaxID=2817894 RepID=UPI001AE596CE